MVELTADFNGPWRGQWLLAEGDWREVAGLWRGDTVLVLDLEGNRCQAEVRELCSVAGLCYVELNRWTWESSPGPNISD